MQHWDKDGKETKMMTQADNYDNFVHVQRGTSPLRPDQRIVLTTRMGTLVMNIDGNLILGRGDEVGKLNVLDLSDYGALTAGVSRRHAQLIRDENGQILVCDLNSSNGTYLNEIPLSPDKSYPLDNGDVLRLGKLIIHILFEYV